MDRESSLIVEFYGIPRQRAGRAELRVPAGTVSDVLAAIQSRCPALAGLVRADGRLGPHYLLSVNGQSFIRDGSVRLGPGDRVLLLSADAGG